MFQCVLYTESNQAMAEYDTHTKVAGLDPDDPFSYSQDCEVTVKLGKAHSKAVAKTVQLFDDYLYGNSSCVFSENANKTTGKKHWVLHTRSIWNMRRYARRKHMSGLRTT